MDALKKKLQSGRWSLLIVSQIATNSPWCKTEPKSARDCFPGCFLVTCGRYCDVWGTSLCFAPFRHLTLWRADQVRRLTGHDVDPGAKPSAQSFWHSGHLVRSATPRLNAVGALHTQGGPKCKTLRVVFKRVKLCFTCNMALSASIEQGRWIPSLPMQWAVRCWTDWNMWGDVGLWRGEEEMFQCGQSTKCTDEIFSLILNHSHHPHVPCHSTSSWLFAVCDNNLQLKSALGGHPYHVPTRACRMWTRMFVSWRPWLCSMQTRSVMLRSRVCCCGFAMPKTTPAWETLKVHTTSQQNKTSGLSEKASNASGKHRSMLQL